MTPPSDAGPTRGPHTVTPPSDARPIRGPHTVTPPLTRSSFRKMANLLERRPHPFPPDHYRGALRYPVSVTRLSCFVDSLGPFVLLTCYHWGRFCRTDIVEDHKRLITINNYFSQDWNDFNLAVRISSLRFSFGRDWNDKFQLRCSNDKFQLRCSNPTESDQSHARRPEDRNCHPVDRGRLRIPKHITNEMHEWVKTLGWGRIGSR